MIHLTMCSVRRKLTGPGGLHRLFHPYVSLRQRPTQWPLGQEPERLPRAVRDSAVAMRYLRLLGPLDWERIPPRVLTPSPPIEPLAYAPYIAACLVKVDQPLGYMSTLRRYLIEHPALIWLLGFPLVPSSRSPRGVDVEASLPTHRHFTHMLRTLPNAILQGLLDRTVVLLREALPPDVVFGKAISLDTKHILAWMKENNPKAFLTGDQRYDKTNQPAGDPDCRLGCKTRRNQQTNAQRASSTPRTDAVPASIVKVGTFYWGYGTGVVATKIPGWGEYVLAEQTQPFDCADVSYFFPLMGATTRRLGRRPTYGAFDAAFDAFYVYEYFSRKDGVGFAAVPRVDRGPASSRRFSEGGLPLCRARTSLVEHEKGRYACPLHVPTPTGTPCPIADPHGETGGCVTALPTSIGARIRHQLDRHSEAYTAVYTQRTATERINSQAVALGIERPKLRNGQAIANHNTLIYIIINLRALQRIRQQQTRRQAVTTASADGTPA